MFKKLLFTIFTLSALLSTLQAREMEVFAKEQAKDLEFNKTIRAFMKDNKKITDMVNKSYAYVAFPSIAKGGLVFGGAYGEGRAYRRGMWVGDVSVTQYTFGLQAGGQTYSEIIFFMTREAFRAFKKGGYVGSTQTSIVPFYSGLSGDVDFAKNVHVFTSSTGGLMLEASTGTQEFIYKSRE